MAFRFEKLTHKSQEAVQRGSGAGQGTRPSTTRADAPARRAARSRSGRHPVAFEPAGHQPRPALESDRGGDSTPCPRSAEETTLGPDLSRVFDTAQDEADRMKDEFVSVEHLLLGILKVKSKLNPFSRRWGSRRRIFFNRFKKYEGDSE